MTDDLFDAVNAQLATEGLMLRGLPCLCRHVDITVHDGVFTDVEVGGGGFVDDGGCELEVLAGEHALGAGEGQ
jgi:hypothetical protein